MDRLAEAAAHARVSHDIGREHAPKRRLSNSSTELEDQNRVIENRYGTGQEEEIADHPAAIAGGGSLSATTSPTLVNGERIRHYVDKDGLEDLPRLRGFHLWHR